MSLPTESYEQAVARTGRKWPYRSKDWPCPACGNPECDLDIDLVWEGKVRGGWKFVCNHVQHPIQSHAD